MLEQIVILVRATAWPLVVLTLVIVLRSDIRKVIQQTKLKRAKMGGVQFDFVHEVERLRTLGVQVEKKFRFARGGTQPNRAHQVANERLSILKLQKSPVAFNLNAYTQMANSDPVSALNALKIEIDRMASNILAFREVPLAGEETLGKKLRILHKTHAINNYQFQLARAILHAVFRAQQSGKTTKTLAKGLVRSARPLLSEYVAWIEQDPTVTERVTQRNGNGEKEIEVEQVEN